MDNVNVMVVTTLGDFPLTLEEVDSFFVDVKAILRNMYRAQDAIGNYPCKHLSPQETP